MKVKKGAQREGYWETKLKTSVVNGMVWLLRTYAFLFASCLLDQQKWA